MRLKFEKGITPEDIANIFVEFVRKNELVIGAVNVYIQTYDNEMKPVRSDEQEYFVCKPSETTKRRYEEDAANLRRARMRVV